MNHGSVYFIGVVAMTSGMLVMRDRSNPIAIALGTVLFLFGLFLVYKGVPR